MGVLAVTGELEIWHMVAIVAVYAGGEAFFGPAFGALVPDVLAGEDLLQANALEQTVRQTAKRLVGPIIGGAIIAASGAGEALLIDAGTFLVSATAIGMMRTVSRGSTTRISSVRDDLVGGLRYARRHSWMWSSFAVSALVMLFFFGPAEVLLPYIVRNEFDGDAGDYSLILAGDGVGSVLASVLLAQRNLPRRFVTAIYLTLAGSTVPVAGYAIASSLWQLVLLATVFGATVTVGIILLTTAQQTRVPAAMRGRIYSLELFTSVSFAPLSFALTAPMAEWIGIDATLVVAGLGTPVIASVLYVALRLRRVEVALGPVDDDGLADASEAEPEAVDARASA
jgi:hypothetical protein